MNLRTLPTFALALACAGAFASTSSAATAPATAPTITYTASGTFVSPAGSGTDNLKLAGEPFSVSIAV